MNLQIHCDNCGRSIHEVRWDSSPITSPLVEFWTFDPRRYFDNELFDRHRQTFCDWRCASDWCLAQRDKS
jgi:hypothetical protein